MLPCEGSGTATTVPSEIPVIGICNKLSWNASRHTVTTHTSPVSYSDSVCSVLVSLVAPEALVKFIAKSPPSRGTLCILRGVLYKHLCVSYNTERHSQDFQSNRQHAWRDTINLFTEPNALKDSFEAKVYTRLLAIADAEKANADDTGDEVDWAIFEYAESNVSQWAGHNEERIWKHV